MVAHKQRTGFDAHLKSKVNKTNLFLSQVLVALKPAASTSCWKGFVAAGLCTPHTHATGGASVCAGCFLPTRPTISCCSGV